MKFGRIVLKQSKYITIAVGGSLLYPKDATNFDVRFFERLKAYFGHLLNKGYRIILVPGGFGGQLFFEDSRKLGCSEIELNKIGSNLIQIASIILARYLKGSFYDKFRDYKISNFNSFNDFEASYENFEISVIGFTLTGASTSDSLAALIGSHVNSELLFLKNLKANKSVIDYVTDYDRMSFSVDKFKDFIFINNYFGKAGASPLDFKVVEILKLTNIKTWVAYKEDIIDCKNFSKLDIYKVII